MNTTLTSPSTIAEDSIELTILMPCLNEAETLGACIDEANRFLSRSGVRGEVLIADNGSTDGSQEIARGKGALVVPVAERGYGAALIGGIKAARGRYIVMGDSDCSYDFANLDHFIAKLREGYDLVMGNRFRGGIAPGAMPPLHKYLGNPVLSGIGRRFFTSNIRDFHCGLRGFRKDSMVRLNLRTTGMEFASEMVVKATLAQLRVTEVPTTLAKDGRSRPPHLRSWRDGWRHLRFLLMYAPRWLFLYPGLFMVAFGLFAEALVLPGPLQIGSVVFDVHTLLVGMASMLVGSEILIFFLLAKQHGINAGLLPEGDNYRRYRRLFTLERALLLGAGMTILGVAGVVTAVSLWGANAFGTLDYSHMMRLLIPSITLLALGIQVIMASFVSGLMDLPVNR
ncbi:MAG: glycosyltransferase family 2 protein [Candidatus Rokuibacteriota bacterium]